MNPIRIVLALALATLALPGAAQAPVPQAAPPASAPPAAAPPTKGAPAAQPPEADYVPTGEVRIRLSATYDATRVRGPGANLTLAQDGRWGGSIARQAVQLQVTPTRISGAGVTLTVTREAERLSIQGTSAGAQVRIVATRTSLDVRVGNRRFNATRDADGSWRQANLANGATNFRFTGSASDPLTAPMPQWVLAVIAAM